MATWLHKLVLPLTVKKVIREAKVVEEEKAILEIQRIIRKEFDLKLTYEEVEWIVNSQYENIKLGIQNNQDMIHLVSIGEFIRKPYREQYVKLKDECKRTNRKLKDVKKEFYKEFQNDIRPKRKNMINVPIQFTKK